MAGFAPITADNRRIVAQEWLAEAFGRELAVST